MERSRSRRSREESGRARLPRSATGLVATWSKVTPSSSLKNELALKKTPKTPMEPVSVVGLATSVSAALMAHSVNFDRSVVGAEVVRQRGDDALEQTWVPWRSAS